MDCALENLLFNSIIVRVIDYDFLVQINRVRLEIQDIVRQVNGKHDVNKTKQRDIRMGLVLKSFFKANLINAH